MAQINLEITTPGKVIYQDTVDSITVPGTKGGFQVLRNHAPLMSTFEIGIVTVQKGDNVQYFTTGGGTIEVLNNNVLILADSMERVEDIDISRAELAKKKAKERLAKKKEEKIDEVRAKTALDKAINRLSAISRFKT
ncbi:ATP synthase epsilon chain [bacterium BMS3Abin03]|nr:ATP synthase epsilon chain [bacterium BMS3Abin03]